ncbi:DUF2147 domain-containing protein [Sneathiella marina]|uniref:DUF2147 domain-containing protein n=1 Tax=Sneathiella marina TaxID=2950108 RepID=A0ABY4VWY3_9PROT|nr:DUF2147 domain-containing protein [Sneathiella marina]USG59472.1 DUF2147 domain-containing protein [Sneathiella marina]
MGLPKGEIEMLLNKGLFFAAVVSLSLLASKAYADVTGTWSTVEGKSHVKIEPCGDKFCGKIVWLKEPNNAEGKPKKDINNTDEALRGRPILGMELLNGFSPESKTEWDDGTIYNPEDGKTYSSTLTIAKSGELEVEGCVLFICKTQVWKKVE